ncbi:ParB N-terminal domain-containing protein [Cocleimonas sp. KMM 6892]|uniref:ParB/RepB/Spo0J family partition protein n=1 Tax=unclassified Cocleimonas TaxID=2639732 RepID=UPI002DB914FE|nr:MULTISPECIES: ParB N-terminal domain-containing protein [unclassified Cocleimonas]MEB8431708.1 ParB N-terminal domain-containing protein [Cocleimonas sp. KMM 6892]MEC4715206.1 ParB N-terminal domain-containing protein [Cocleimonas sp. KMM 6895]MEC4743980.1 ParB N-terminal domain-containing protein [Cocleimonas sp. KMM 6896]
MELATRQLSDIKRNSEYLRHGTDVDTLKKSIESIGLINPLTINKDNELLAGSRRFQAVTELGWKEVDVHVVDRDLLQQELISIDENLVREPLNRLELEKCLNRGREIYEQLNPNAIKIDVSNESLNPENKLKEKEQEKVDNDSFAAITSEKTGLSKSVIKSAIKRDELAADSVKQARSQGELNASQTNEIIQLNKELQEKVLPLIADKTVKEAKQIIKAVKQGGIEAAIQENENFVPLPKEYTLLKSPIKRVNKNLSRILIEGLKYDGPEKDQINKEMFELKENLVNYFKMLEED